MSKYENLHLIHDAVVDWEESFMLDLSQVVIHREDGLVVKDLSKHVVVQEGVGHIDKYTYINGKTYLITPTGHLWPV